MDQFLQASCYNVLDIKTSKELLRKKKMVIKFLTEPKTQHLSNMLSKIEI